MDTTSFNHAIFKRKVGLLIGNQNYRAHEDQLFHTINDVNDISHTLRTMNFHVRKHYDLCNSEMKNVFSEFSKTIRNGDLIIFYFSGHGCEMNGKNYLLPIDDELIAKEQGIEDSVIHTEQILCEWSQQFPSSIIIFILDCCRLPYSHRHRQRRNNVKYENNASEDTKVPRGTYVVFACSQYQIASDGLLTERNGLYAKHLLQHLTKPNKDLRQLFRSVNNGVCIESKQRQKPTRHDGLIDFEPIYLIDRPSNSNDGKKKTKVEERLLVK
ncbi:unnamed protein product [Adineta ricciae]|uniref:Caspase family p20 domain-containing protein n=1 Tax=Adineta ricciae TaxID=249248 RepID=A0A815J1P7_ADIRI|nr:unnamed protein product [Adineta ricciae]CAF1443239.1 unnamed protein product [Adineta ricciae]